MTAGQCEYEGCQLPVMCWVAAQWTIADFVRFEVCFDHDQEVYDQLAGRVVEGMLPAMSWGYYDVDIDWLKPLAR